MKTSFDIKEPGLNVLPPGVERHVINGGGLTGIQIFPDDEIEIINDEGNQVCEIVVFDKDGKSDLGILNLKENSKNSEIKKILTSKDESSLIANHQLKKRNLDITKSKSSLIFSKDSISGDKINFKSKDKCYVIFAAPGEDMLVHEQNPVTDLTIFIKRANVINDKELSVIPDPVYDPKHDDFVAFDTQKLDKKIEKGLDWQTTRTFMGHTFPGPGLFSKCMYLKIL